MTERAKEITIHKEMLQTQIKTAESERQTIKSVVNNMCMLVNNVFHIF